MGNANGGLVLAAWPLGSKHHEWAPFPTPAGLRNQRASNCPHTQTDARAPPAAQVSSLPLKGCNLSVMTSAFLDFSKSRGNDLSTPMPEFGFPGLQPGDRWCLCASRWRDAFEANKAPAWCWRACGDALLFSRRASRNFAMRRISPAPPTDNPDCYTKEEKPNNKKPKAIRT